MYQKGIWQPCNVQNKTITSINEFYWKQFHYSVYNRFVAFYKLSLRSNLNLLEFITNTLKPSKFMAQLHCNLWSDIADCLSFLRCFLIRLEVSICSYTYVTFYRKKLIPERLNTWESPILQENTKQLRTLNSLQYLTIYYNVIVP